MSLAAFKPMKLEIGAHIILLKMCKICKTSNRDSIVPKNSILFEQHEQINFGTIAIAI